MDGLKLLESENYTIPEMLGIKEASNRTGLSY